MSVKIENYEKICESIKAIDPKIRFAGVINERGHLDAGGLRENTEPLESAKEDEMNFMEIVLRVKMRKDFDKQLGTVNFAMASRKNILEISIPLNEDILYVVSEPDMDYCSLPKKILKIISS